MVSNISHHIVKPAGASAIIGCSTIGHRQLGNGQQQEKHGWNLDFILHTNDIYNDMLARLSDI